MLLIVLILMANPAKDEFVTAEKAWRAEREAKLKKDDSWFTLAGLHWLVEGENRFGIDEGNALVLPRHSTVAWAGSFFLEAGKVRYKMEPGQLALYQEKPKPAGVLKVDDVLSHNNLRFVLIERGGKLAIRLRDLRNPGFLNFKELDFYPPSERYVVEASYERFDPPHKLTISTVINTEEEVVVPGKLTFSFEGKTYSLLTILEGPDEKELFLNFRDKTAGKTTYGAGRFMYIPIPTSDKVKLNFNRAYNPPCCYTDYATCPLPPEENKLDFSIEAGERVYERAHGSH